MDLVSVFLFILGLVIGSFLNCVIYRIEVKKSFLSGRSFCPSCKHQLSWLDLIPVLSYILLSGSCRYCKKRISVQYPLVEMATGFLFLFLFNPDHFIRSSYWVIIFSLFIIIFVYDLKHYIIPDKIILPAIGVALAYNTFAVLTGDFSPSYYFQTLWAGTIPALFFFSLFVLSRGKWIGFGDVKLALAMGFLLGPNRIIVALFLAFVIGGIIAVGLIILGKKHMKAEMPFAPFLLLGTVLAHFLGNSMINYYLHLN
ncbi:prepilin peptidase [Patescibacteria group bacterium]|nr:prepilin peptidase [Patescibacteria group bacterium]